jgi:hypothetical protein
MSESVRVRVSEWCERVRVCESMYIVLSLLYTHARRSKPARRLTSAPTTKPPSTTSARTATSPYAVTALCLGVSTKTTTSHGSGVCECVCV